MRIWISGAGGFLGRSMLTALKGSSLEVNALTSGVEKLREAYIDAKNIHILPADALCNESEMCDGDILLSCAYPRNEDAAKIAAGLDYIKSLFDAAKRLSFAGVINISSQSVYSRMRTEAAVETDDAVLENAYAVGKYMVELLADAILSEIPHTSIRMASLIGAGFDQRIPNRLIDQVIAGKNLSVRDDHQTFGFLDVEDAVTGIMMLLQKKPDTWKSVYNLGAEGGYSLKEIAKTVRDVMKREYGKDVEISLVPDEAYANSTVDSSLLSADTGYKPSVSLEESVKRIAAEKMI